jgi:hypothetical protein
MPLPEPTTSESQEEFTERCMGALNDEYPDRDQRYAVCMAQWRGRKEKTMERKSFTGVQLKADTPGHFIAKIAELNVIDKDGDVTLPGAFPEGKQILISAYQHGSWSGGLPVGKAVIHEEGENVLIEGAFNLNTETGKEHYETIKFAPELQEWSYGFETLEAPTGTQGGQNVRFLKKLDVFEASPVLRGAGIGTGMVAIKTDGQTFADQAEAALAAVDALVERAKSLADLRRSEGRNISQSSRERMAKLQSEITSLLETMPDDLEKGRQALRELKKLRDSIGAI